jgi:hypothetical protein
MLPQMRGTGAREKKVERLLLRLCLASARPWRADNVPWDEGAAGVASSYSETRLAGVCGVVRCCAGGTQKEEEQGGKDNQFGAYAPTQEVVSPPLGMGRLAVNLLVVLLL